MMVLSPLPFGMVHLCGGIFGTDSSRHPVGIHCIRSRILASPVLNLSYMEWNAADSALPAGCLGDEVKCI